MPEPTYLIPQEGSSPDHLPVTDSIDPMFLQNTALRYAAADLNPEETAAFEARLANNQDARDALSEAVRLSAAALGQAPLAPHPSFRAAIRERLFGWWPGWLARRAYRGHPLLWAGFGASAIAACTVFGLSLTDREPIPTVSPTSAPKSMPGGASEPTAVMVAPEPQPVDPEAMTAISIPHDHTTGATALATCHGEPAATPSVAEIWASLSTPDHMEKAHDDELRWRQKLRDLGVIHPGRAAPTASFNDPREP
jgi:hypothetical protein